MKICSVKLNNYRNYQQVDITLGDGITMLSGKNGQGKTNFVESIYFASTTKSPRSGLFVF